MSNTKEPNPVPNNFQPTWELVVQDMLERNKLGTEKYGTPLQPHNGRNSLVDAYQEALDYAVYLKNSILQGGVRDNQVDVMSMVPTKQLDDDNQRGHVALLDVMPRLVPLGATADYAVAEMARTSFRKTMRGMTPVEIPYTNIQLAKDRGLIRRLMRHRHTSPFEGVEFKFHIKVPLFVMRQMDRHRTASVNQESLRYSVSECHYYLPGSVLKQDTGNKQMSSGECDDVVAHEFLNDLHESNTESTLKYDMSIERGVSREQARMLLNMNLYVSAVWKIDLHNLLHFLSLRCAPDAQPEIQDVANKMLTLISPVVPLCVEAWNYYHPSRDGMLLSKGEIDSIRGCMSHVVRPLQSDNKTECEEWVAKAKKLGMVVEA